MIITSLRIRLFRNEKDLYYYMLNLCCCAFGQQNDLILQIIASAMPFIMSEPHKLTQCSNGVNDDCLAMQKSFLMFMKIVLILVFKFYIMELIFGYCIKIYRIEFIDLDGNNLSIDFRSTIDSSLNSLESLIINYRAVSSCKMPSLLAILKFDRTDMLEGFLLDLFKSKVNNGKFHINAANLNLIIKSESIRQMIYEHKQNSLIQRQPFCFDSAEFFKIDHDYDFPYLILPEWSITVVVLNCPN